MSCRVLDPDLQTGYSGGCRDGFADGIGEAWGLARYQGEFRAGRKHGVGAKTWADGDQYSGEWKDDEPVGALTPRMLARKHEERVRIAAVSKPGQLVCRQVTIGSVTPDWLRASVVEANGPELVLRIEHPGNFEHRIGGAVASKGAQVRDQAMLWSPCKER